MKYILLGLILISPLSYADSYTKVCTYDRDGNRSCVSPVETEICTMHNEICTIITRDQDKPDESNN